jgi:hypothetical protein
MSSPAFCQRLEPLEFEEAILLPMTDGASRTSSIRVRVPAWRDPKDGDIYYDGDSLRQLDEAKARAMGLQRPPGRTRP